MLKKLTFLPYLTDFELEKNKIINTNLSAFLKKLVEYKFNYNFLNFVN